MGAHRSGNAHAGGEGRGLAWWEVASLGKQEGAEDERSLAGVLEPAWGEQLEQQRVKSHVQEQGAQQGPGFSDLPQMSRLTPPIA